MSGSTAAAPPGFMLFAPFGPPGFAASCGQIWMKAEDEKLVWGFRVEPLHCNPQGSCHGGMLATFCDMHMGLAAQFESRIAALILPTVTLSVDYLAPTRLGAWVEARVRVLKITRGLVFAEETVLGDGEPVAHARGIYKIPAPSADTADTRLRNTGEALRQLLGG